MFWKRLSIILVLNLVTVLGSVAIAQQPAADPAAEKQAAPAGGLRVGDPVAAGQVHRVSRPGLYGMSAPPAGSAYGIVDNRLIRFDPDSGRVLSIIRQVDEILD